MNILVLCHGNVNRSALCAALLKKEVSGKHTVKSAGFLEGGRRAAAKMRDAAKEFDVDLEEHRSTTVTKSLVKWADLIIDMDAGNRKRFVELFSNPKSPDYVKGAINKVQGLGHYINLPRIADPNYMKRGSSEFYFVVRQIHAATQNLAKTIK